MGKNDTTGSGRRRRRGGEQEEQEQEQEQEEQDVKPSLMPPPPPRRGRSTRASSSSSASASASRQEEEEEQDVLNGGGGDEEEDDAGSSAAGKGKAKRRASGGNKPAAKKRASSAVGKAEHAAQSGYFCDEEVEVGFTFTQVSFSASEGGGRGGRRNRQAGDGGMDQDVKYPGTQQVSQDVLQNHEENKFNQLPKAQQDAAVGAAVRFILFKGCRREPILKKAVNDEVAKHYGRSLVKPILKEAAAKLEKTFGYMLIAPPVSNFPKEKDTYYLVNKVKNPALQRQLNAYGRDVGYRGFVIVVLGLLFCSAASKIKEKELLEQIATLDDDLLFTKGDEESSIAGTLDGIGDVALALERMRKEHYIVREKELGLKKPGQDGQPLAEFWFKLGPRAYVEVGPRQLLKFLSESQGQEEDATLLREIEQEEARNAAELAESQA